MSGARPAGRGVVFLVGAGPGDPELLTLRGADVLRRADVVVYDALAHPALLDLAPPGAERIDVGRRGHEPRPRSQDEINALLVERAREGKTVVRLKGGDPFVFGRGGEEASACAEAGVPCEVVPGVTSALAAPALAGIPVTDRRHAASFAVVTGHKDPTRVSEALRWDAIAGAVDTLVILMGTRNLDAILEQVLRVRSPGTPAAAVMWAGTRRQRVVEAPLSELADRVREARLGAPTTVVVGDVVRLRRQLGFRREEPLASRRVLVTRGEDQAQPLLEALEAAGAEAVHLPLLYFEPAADPGALDACLARLADYDALLFTSANAVRFTAARAAATGVALGALRGIVLCVGPATAAAARRAGLRVDRTPAGRRDAEGLLEEVAKWIALPGKRLLLPRSQKARDALPDGLRAAGAEVDAPVAYRTLPPGPDSEVAAALRTRLARGQLDVLTFTSPSSVRHFAEVLDAEARAAARACTIAAIGPVTARALREAGLAPQVVAESPEPEVLVAALAAHEAAGAARRGGPREGGSA